MFTFRSDDKPTILPRRIFVLTGAGVSAESGLSTFRGAEGLWRDRDWRTLASPEGFAADPGSVHAFYNARRAGLAEVEPNPAHFALARLEQALETEDGVLTLCTQNVDDLHERSGSRRVIHMHGELLRIRCVLCGDERTWRLALSTTTPCSGCGKASGLRPAIVWFGEEPLRMEEIVRALKTVDLFVAIGTSGAVWPAAGFAALARRAGAMTLALNLEPALNAADFDQSHLGPASRSTPALVEAILGARLADRPQASI